MDNAKTEVVCLFVCLFFLVFFNFWANVAGTLEFISTFARDASNMT